MQATKASKAQRQLNAILSVIGKACGPDLTYKIYEGMKEIEKDYCFSEEGKEPCTAEELAAARNILEWMENPPEE